MPLDNKASERQEKEIAWGADWCSRKDWSEKEYANFSADVWASGTTKRDCAAMANILASWYFTEHYRSELCGSVTPIAESREVSAVFWLGRIGVTV